MKSKAQRIAIAEACPKLFQILNGDCHYRFCCEGEESKVDPLNDLNAMHEAEKVLEDKWMPYARKLLEITTGCGANMPLGFLNGATLCSAVHATAAQRAEAFLRTIGKWEELEKSP